MTSSLGTPEPGGGGLAEREEPLASVLGLGGSEDRLVFVVALLAALAVHAVAGARALRVFPYLAELTAVVRNGMQERLRSQVDIDLNEPPPPPKPEPEPEKDPEPPPPAQQKAPEPAAPPPAAAEAGKVLTAEPDPDEPVDFGNTIVSGEGDRFAGGVTAPGGTSTTAVRDKTAVATGVGTGAPKVAAVPAGPKVDLSRAPKPLNSNWDCPFPSEAEAEGINAIKVQVVVTVTREGRARTASVQKDPGFGFGRAARACAMRNAYAAALDASGNPIEQTFSVNVRFTR